MVKTLVIAGHGLNRDGSFDPGASGYITKGEHEYYAKDFFPAVRKYLPLNHDVILFDVYNVYDRGNIIALAKSYGSDTQVIECHFDATGSSDASGGHVIIHGAYNPDKLDLALRDWIKKFIGVRYIYKGHAGISGRRDLGNCNLSYGGGVNYRLIELGFGTNRRDANTMVNKVDDLAKEFVRVICGEINIQVVSKTYTFTDRMEVRNKPDLSEGNRSGVYYNNGETVYLDNLIEGSSYIWGTYLERLTNQRRYIILKNKKENKWYGTFN